MDEKIQIELTRDELSAIRRAVQVYTFTMLPDGGLLDARFREMKGSEGPLRTALDKLTMLFLDAMPQKSKDAIGRATNDGRYGEK